MVCLWFLLFKNERLTQLLYDYYTTYNVVIIHR